MPSPKLWSKDFFKGFAANFFMLMNVLLLMVVMSEYAMVALGSSPSKAGLATGIFVIGALFSRLFSGQLIERMGQRKMLLSGTGFSLAMTALYFVTTNIWLLYVVRILHGMGYGIASVAIITVVTNILPKSRQGEGIGYYMLSITLGLAIGPFMAIFTMQYGGFTHVFLVGVIFAVISIASVLSISIPVITDPPETISKNKELKWSNFLEGSAIPISIVCALVFFAYSSLLSFLTPYAREIHLMHPASFFFLVFAVIILISRPYTGRLFDSKGENSVMYQAFAFFGVGMILLGQTDQAITLLLASVFLGLGFGIVQALGMATALKGVPRQRVSFASSTFYVFVDVGLGIGPSILGLFIPFLGYRGMYLSLAVVSFSCLLVYYLLHGRKAVPPGSRNEVFSNPN